MRKAKILSLMLSILILVVACGCGDTAKEPLESWVPTGDTEVSDSFELWVTNALDRVRQNRPSNGKNTIALTAAKGEYESFQIVACTEAEQAISLTSLKISDFISKNGDVIAADKYVTVYREHYISCQVQSPASSSVIQETTGMIADALIPVINPTTGEVLDSGSRFCAFPFELSSAACQPFFIDVFIPRDAATGEYIATYEMQSDSGAVGGMVTLNVYDVKLSDTQIQGSYFGSWSSASEAKVVEAAKNRMFINAISKEQQEKLYKEYGYNNANLGFWSNADINNTDKMEPAPTVDEVTAKKAKQYQKLNQFAYTADEIGGSDNLNGRIIEYAQALHKAGVKQLITMPPTESLLDDGLGNNQAAVDIWVMLPKQFDSNTELIEKARSKKDAEIWTYNCLVQDTYSPKYLLDYPLIDFRIQPGFINYAIDAEGFLFWVIDNWNTVGDPWESLDMRFNGDGILFYPGEDVGLDNTFVPSLRAKAIRDGFEDYELLKALEEKQGKKLDTSKVATNFSSWTQDANTLITERAKLFADIN